MIYKDMETQIEIREEIIELNYYLLEAMLKEDTDRVIRIREDINSLIDLYLKK